MSITEPEVFDAFEIGKRASKDVSQAATMLGQSEARFLVDQYYQIQKYRISTAAQIRSSGDDEPNRVLSWVFDENDRVENGIKCALGRFARNYNVGQWLLSICGIGPVISAGLLAELDVRQCKTAGHFWRFAGLDPTTKWERKTKRPWNARLKTLCAFKLGECFVKVQNRDSDFYGTVFRQRKDLELQRNENREFSDQAAEGAQRVGKTTEAYKFYMDGRLPPAHIHSRARRYAVKLFLSHLHHVMYHDYFGSAPPVPYVFEHVDGDHRHFIEPPNYPFKGTGRPLSELLKDNHPE